VNPASLKLFRDIAQTRSFSRAAAANDITQSAASQAVQELERSLKVALLDRSVRPLAVTPEGEIYAAYCRDVLRRHDEMLSALKHLREDISGGVRVASIYSVGLTELIQLERRFAEEHPNADLTVSYLQPAKVYRAVLEGEVDLGLISYPEPSRDLMVIPWRREEMVLAAAPDHPLAKKAAGLQGPLPVEELSEVDFVGFDHELPIRHAVDRFLKEKGVEVKVTLHFDNIEMVKEAVALKAGVSILPHRVMRDDLRQKRLTAIRLAGSALYRPLGIIHRKKRQFSPVVEAFLDMLREAPVEGA